MRSRSSESCSIHRYPVSMHLPDTCRHYGSDVSTLERPFGLVFVVRSLLFLSESLRSSIERTGVITPGCWRGTEIFRGLTLPLGTSRRELVGAIEASDPTARRGLFQACYADIRQNGVINGPCRAPCTPWPQSNCSRFDVLNKHRQIQDATHHVLPEHPYTKIGCELGEFATT